MDHTGAWLPRRPRRQGTTLQLYCLPHAGAGSSTYRDWQALVDPLVDVVPIQLPGRERRIAEPLPSSVDQLAHELAEAFGSRPDDTPFALFGHSMGALVGYELASVLAARGNAPQHVVVSGYPPPHLPRDRQVHRLPDDAFVKHLTDLEGTPKQLLTDDELLHLTLPILRADFAICETYQHPDREPLPVPMTIFGGHADPTAKADVLPQWNEVCSYECDVRIFEGGHFYLHDQLPDVIDTLMRILRPTAGLV